MNIKRTLYKKIAMLTVFFTIFTNIGICSDALAFSVSAADYNQTALDIQRQLEQQQMQYGNQQDNITPEQAAELQRQLEEQMRQQAEQAAGQESGQETGLPEQPQQEPQDTPQDDPPQEQPEDQPGQPQDVPPDPMNLKVLPSTNQINFSTIQKGDIVTPVPFSVTNINQADVDIFCYEYGTDPDAFIVDLPEDSIAAPGQSLNYTVTVSPDLSPGTYECSLVFTASLIVYGAENDNSTVDESAIKCTVTVTENTPKVEKVLVHPNVVNLQKGTAYSFTSDVLPDNLPDKSVIWGLDGESASGTMISSDGRLVIDSNETSTQLTVYAKANADKNVIGTATVNIEDDSFSVNTVADPWNGGAVSGGGIYKAGSQCVLTASENNGFSFAGWYIRDRLVGTNKTYCINGVSSNMTVTARFEQNKAYVYLESSNNDYGYVSDSGYVTIGQDFNIKATPNEGYRFVCWKENNNEVTKDAEYTLRNVTGTRRLTALFEPKKIQINLVCNPANTGVLTGAGSYDYGKDAIITAAPVSGYRFVGWLHDNNYFSTDASTTLYNLKCDYSIVAVFEQENAVTYDITTKVSGGKGTVYPSGVFPVTAGKDIPISVTPATGYQVRSVVVDGVNQGAVPGYMFRNVDRAHNVEVTFEPIPGASNNNQKPVAGQTNNDKDTDKGNTDGDISNIVDNDILKDTDDKKPSPEDEPVIPVYDDDNLIINPHESAAVSGVLQEYGISPEQARDLISRGDTLATDMFREAIREGYLNITINNEFADNTQETADASYDNVNSSVPNFVEVMSACTTPDEGVKVLSGQIMGYNLSISGYDIGVPEAIKTQLDAAAMENGQQVAEYMDVFFSKSMNHEVTPITETPKELEIIIKIPDNIKGLSNDFSIVRVHRQPDGTIENTLLKDMDDDPDTITIHTNKFSSYGIVYPASADALHRNENRTPNKPLMIALLIALIVAITASVVFPVKAIKGKRKRK